MKNDRIKKMGNIDFSLNELFPDRKLGGYMYYFKGDYDISNKVRDKVVSK